MINTLFNALKRSLLLLALLAGTSCLKPPSLSDDNGPEVPVDQVQKAILEGWDNADFNSVRLNEFLYVEQDQKIATLDPKVVYKEATQVIARVENADTVDYKFLIRSQAMDNGSFKPVTAFENDISIPKTVPTLTGTPALAEEKTAFPNSLETLQKSLANGSVGLRAGGTQSQFLGVLTVRNMLGACVKAKDWDVTCHNLQVSEGKRPAPTGVASKPDCGGIPNCEVNYKKVSFDLVVNLVDEKTNTTHPEKVNYEMTFSSDVPYLSRLLEFCYLGMVPTATQKVIVKICNKVQSFEVGTTN
ncbi:MAG TPA: hypothetical protein VIG33_12785 [Pseudobdellovibrionaceae bacterium]|jgi:hypothetical protein